MRVCLFLGPTLRPEDVPASLGATCLAPVAQGDVYRAGLLRPRAIGIVDGYFSGAPSVWHKEILWALTQGIHVFGSASMGALRAAELHSFGMRGIGRIFEDYRDGILEDDDEVAVVHGPAELGYAQLSEPMVNIRATLARAEGEGVLIEGTRRDLEAIAKSLFFPERLWHAVLEEGKLLGLPGAELAGLAQWLKTGRVDQKRDDALAMLQAMAATLDAGEKPRADFRFEWTNFWDEMLSQPAGERASGFAAVIDELRLEGGDAYERTRTKALLRLFASLEAKRRGLEASRESMQQTLIRLRSALGLFNRSQLDDWLQRNHLDEAALERLVADLAHSEKATRHWGPSFDVALLDELRLEGNYERLAERAEQKRQALTGIEASMEGEAGPSALQLRHWYFSCLDRPVPDDVEAFAREFGFAELRAFDIALRREWVYRKLKN